MSRTPSRLALFGAVAFDYAAGVFSARKKASYPKRILIAHHLLLGDTLMLTPLLAKLRLVYPQAEIIMTCPKAFATLYAKRPYNVAAIAYDPRDAATFSALYARRGFDLALLPADSRFSWLARALRSRWIVDFSGDTPDYKNWPVDEHREYPPHPAAFGDIATMLIDGPAPPPYRVSDWPAPEFKSFDRPAGHYAVLHLGASTPLKQWAPDKWRKLSEWLALQGIETVWSAGKAEQDLVREVDPQGKHRSYAGALDLAQLWQLFLEARLLVCPDTGVAHLARLVGTPTVTLFGPGSAMLCGAGEFWGDSPFVGVTIDIACRDQDVNFKRRIPWLRRCERFPGNPPERCPQARCMEGITTDAVLNAATQLLKRDASGSANRSRG